MRAQRSRSTRRVLLVCGVAALLAGIGVAAALGFGLDAGLGAVAVAALVALAVVAVRLGRARRRADALERRDPGSGLPNRTALEEELAHVTGKNGAVAVIAIDGLGTIADVHGHRDADALVTAVAGRLADQLRGEDAMARVGDEELGVVLAHCRDPEPVLARIREAVEDQLATGAPDVAVGVSVGYAVGAGDGAAAGELLRRATVAAHAARSRQQGVERFDAGEDPRDAAGLALAGELHRAIEHGELVLHYQPVARATDRRCVSVEALLRWRHPTLGVLDADRFVPLAERTALVDAITAWVVHRALRDTGVLQVAAGMIPVSINLAPRTLAWPGLRDVVERELAANGQPAEVLMVEVPESAVAADPAGIGNALSAMRAVGVRSIVDRVGRGPSALGALAGLPIEGLRLDASVVARVAQGRADTAVVRSVAALAHDLDLSLTAVGVETEAAWAAVAAAGCDLVQGRRLAPPMPVEKAASWLVLRHRRAVLPTRHTATVS